MMNQCHFLGNFVRDPEIKTTDGGKKVVNFTLGINRRYKRGTETVKDPAFIDCEAWDTGAETISKFFKKGDAIIVHCAVKQENWNDKTTGDKRSRLKFRVNSFDFVHGGNKKNGAGAPAEQDPGDSVPDQEPVNVGNGEDIPF